MLTHLVPLTKRPRIAGALGGIEAVATIAAPSLGGIIVGNLSWRRCFWINLPTGALSFAIIVCALKLDQDIPPLTFWQKIVKLDLLGNALFVPSLTCCSLRSHGRARRTPGTVEGSSVCSWCSRPS